VWKLDRIRIITVDGSKKELFCFVFPFFFFFLIYYYPWLPLLITFELCLVVTVDGFSTWSEITVSNSPYAFSDLLYFWYFACRS